MNLKTMFVLIWVAKSFVTMNGLVKFLNTLPTERQLEAQIVGFDASSVVYLVYRKEQSSE